MYNESYDEYIRSILGYPNYQSDNYMNTYNNEYFENNIPQNSSNDEIEECYPEIYKIVYPMVRKACTNNSEPMTPELIERMTDDIYSSIEADNIINISNVNINLTNDIKNNENRNTNIPRNNLRQDNKSTSEYKENKNSEINRNLRDLIKILLIRELLGGIRNPGRPPMPPSRPPMRPPFPGGPGRPPFGPGPRPRPNNRYYDIYEY